MRERDWIGWDRADLVDEGEVGGMGNEWEVEVLEIDDGFEPNFLKLFLSVGGTIG